MLWYGQLMKRDSNNDTKISLTLHPPASKAHSFLRSPSFLVSETRRSPCAAKSRLSLTHFVPRSTLIHLPALASKHPAFLQHPLLSPQGERKASGYAAGVRAHTPDRFLSTTEFHQQAHTHHHTPTPRDLSEREGGSEQRP